MAHNLFSSHNSPIRISQQEKFDEPTRPVHPRAEGRKIEADLTRPQDTGFTSVRHTRPPPARQ